MANSGSDASRRGFPVIIRAVIVGLLVAMIAINIWLVFLYKLNMPKAAFAEVAFLAIYIWWFSGGGPPKSLKSARAHAFRAGPLTGRQWTWGLVAAFAFAATVHAAIVVLFRFVPFPAAAFHVGYDLSFIKSTPMKWLAVIVSAASAGICEETGFRGYMQRPIEGSRGPGVAILVSTLFFTLIHLSKDWSTAGMVPIVFGAGLLLGALAWASGSLAFCIIGHTVMDIGLFAYWWTQIAGTFSQRPISETGVDQTFYIEAGLFGAALLITVIAITRLRSLRT